MGITDWSLTSVGVRDDISGDALYSASKRACHVQGKASSFCDHASIWGVNRVI